ncbi:hypothetical protein BD410DRAFT_804752 [Rickenella mellea]|uniref:Uncharacterized protein n=1 Tax=Rickenella mellea TaxID=50990 RepID=A0A4Y7Q0N2_9AGAM|nr:hypothetical protein BD410DRAFT_804752 [Rickenella mellea]
MGGIAIAFVGFPIDMKKVHTYMTSHGLGPANPFPSDVIKKLLRKLEEETSITMYLADIEDSEGKSVNYLCHYVNYGSAWIQDYDTLAHIAAETPEKFHPVVQTLGRDGTSIKKMSAANAHLYKTK